MVESFVIMAVGDPAVDRVYRDGILPTLQSFGLQPFRADPVTAGTNMTSNLLKSIERADIVVADLTGGNPNVYLEVGCAMGLGKLESLIFTVRETDPVHIDLMGADVLNWSPDRLGEFILELERRVKGRLAAIKARGTAAARTWNMEWIDRHQAEAMRSLRTVQQTGFMELKAAVVGPKPDINQRGLLDAVKGSEIHTFGWPIGVVLENREEFRPRPLSDEIVANVCLRDRGSLDYWSARKNGDFYLLKTLFENERRPNFVFFNTRIVRVAESVLFLAGFYTRLGVAPTENIQVGLRHGGLKGRHLGAVGNRHMSNLRTTTADEVETVVQFPLKDVHPDLVRIVKGLVSPLFMVFDYFDVADSIWEDIVRSFEAGKVT